MDNRFIIVIWHQAGSNDNGKRYYTLNDEDSDLALVFESRKKAEEFWSNCWLRDIHAAFIVDATTSEVEWA
jgi:hypothetical protein